MFVLPYAAIEKLAVGKNTQAAIIRILLSEIIRTSPFNEQAYLDDHPDVAEAVRRGDWPSGQAHFAAAGYFEGRWAPPFEFSEDWYLERYPDVREAVEARVFHSGEEHYHAAGLAEWRSPAAAAAADVELWKRAVSAVSDERQTRALERNKPLYEAWRARKAATVEVTPALFPVGTLSPRGDLMLGRDGTAFLIGGVDTPLPQYGRDPAEVAAVAAEVVALFQRRRESLTERRVNYLQLIIPEKLSVFAEAFAVEISVPTPLLALVEERCASLPEFGGNFIGCYDLFRADPQWRETFRPVDKHLAPYGAYRLVQAILARLRLAPLPEIVFDLVRTSAADMSDRFAGLLETFRECDPSWAAACEKILESRQTLGDVGKRQSWRCDRAPYRMKVLAFGNSYFDFAERGQYSLSWWMARLFGEYEFAWFDTLNLDIVDELKPDLVICQTVERFLHRVPER